MLDDILSALDSNVGSFIAEHTLAKVLKGRTVILSTHAPQYLCLADRIIVMDQCSLARSGSFEEVKDCQVYTQYLAVCDALQDSFPVKSCPRS